MDQLSSNDATCNASNSVDVDTAPETENNPSYSVENGLILGKPSTSNFTTSTPFQGRKHTSTLPDATSEETNLSVNFDGETSSGTYDTSDHEDITVLMTTTKEVLDFDNNLPDTVTLLTTQDGCKVYLVGTCHFSLESQEDVAKVIQAVKPHIVLVELCKARVNILQLDEKTILDEAQNINFAKMHSTIKQNGFFHGIMYILLLSISAHFTRELGMAPGGEFRRAFAEAKRVPMCLIHLGDRAIHVTLKRAIASLSWWQTVRLFWHLLMSKGPISKEEVECCKRRDLLEEMLLEMAGEFPPLGTVFVEERDIYLTHSLQLAATAQLTPEGVVPGKVVGVVGIGHVPGIVKNWGKVEPTDIPPLVRLPGPTLSGRIFKLTLKVSVVSLIVWGVSKLVPIPQPSLSTFMTVQRLLQNKLTRVNLN